MRKRKKQLDRLRGNPNNVSLDTLVALLESYGFRRQTRAGSSHCVFKRDGCPGHLSVPFARAVNSVYVRRAIEIIERYGEQDD